MDQQNQNAPVQSPSDPRVASAPPAQQPNLVNDPPQSASNPVPSQPATPSVDQSPPAEDNYIINVGQSMVDLLTDISLSDARKQKIATEMRLPVEQVESLCTGLLEKIDNEQLTEAELAFLITAPVADTVSDQDSSS